MWTKTLNVKFKGQLLSVQIWLNTTNENNQEGVKIQSMMNEYFLEEIVLFEDRDKAYDFIRHYPQSMALAFITREAYSVGAINN